MKRRILPMIMAVMMILSIIQVPAWAATGDDPAGEDGNPGQVSEQPVEESAEPSAPVEEEEPASNETNSLPNGETEEEPAPEESADNYVAEVNGDKFTTLQAAIDKAGDNVETTVKLIDDIVMSTSDIVTIPEGKLIVLDMDGKSITVDSSFEGRPIVNNGTLTITGDGKIDSSAAETTGYGAVNNFGTLTIESGYYSNGKQAKGSTIYNRQDSKLTINGGEIQGNMCAAIINISDLTVNGGKICNTSCNKDNFYYYALLSGGAYGASMVINDGEVIGTQGAVSFIGGTGEINGGSFKTQGCPEHGNTGSNIFYALYVAGEEDEVACEVNGGIFETEGKQAAALIGNDNTGGDGGINADATTIINNGTFKAPKGVSALKDAPKTGDPIIYGGTFSSDVSKYLAPSSNITTDSNGNWVVAPLTEENAVASVGGKYYNSLSAAIAEAKDGDTVTLLKDNETTDTIVVSENLTLDLHGCTLTLSQPQSEEPQFVVSSTGDLTIRDTLGNGKMDITGSLGVKLGKLTLESGTIESDYYGIYVYDNGIAVINGGTIKIQIRGFKRQ